MAAVDTLCFYFDGALYLCLMKLQSGDQAGHRYVSLNFGDTNA